MYKRCCFYIVFIGTKKSVKMQYNECAEREQSFGMIPSIRNAQKSTKKRLFFVRHLVAQWHFIARFTEYKCVVVFFFFVDSDVVDHSMFKE